MKLDKFTLSQNAHVRLGRKYLWSGNKENKKNRIKGYYHVAVHTNQQKTNRIMTKEERKKTFQRINKRGSY